MKRVEYAGRKIKLIPYSTAVEKELLLYIATNTEYNIDEVLEILSDNIIVEKGKINSEIEKLAIVSVLRQISVDDMYSFKITCNSCKKKFEEDVEFENIIKPGVLKKYKSYKLKDALSEEYCDYVDFDIDDLETEEYDDLVDYIDNNRTQVNLSKFLNCPYCKAKNKIVLDSKLVINNLSNDTLTNMYKSISSMVFYGHYTKSDIDGMLPFERDIFIGLLNQELENKNKL